MARETWYILDDGTSGNPAECTNDDAGVLRHKDGKAVAIGPYGHRSRGVDVPDATDRQIETKPSVKPGKNREVKAGAGAKTYETR